MRGPRCTTTAGRSVRRKPRSSSPRSCRSRSAARRAAATSRSGRTRSSGRRNRSRPDLSPLYASGVEPQRKAALWSVFAAVALIALKLVTGLATHSLGLISASADSGTDLIAALLTFFAVGVAVRPADPGHQYGHGKAEHLAALAEGAILVLASVFIMWRAIVRLVDGGMPVNATWYALLVMGIVIGIDLARTTASWRAARAYSSPALSSNALHFGSDLAGSVAVLVGLLLVRGGYPRADAVEAADADVRERAHAAALNVPRVREVHNVSVLSVDSGTELSLHLKLPGDLSLEEAHAIGEEVERAIERAVPEVSSVQTHLEPLGEEAAGTEVAGDAATVRRIVRSELGIDPAELRFVDTDEGLVAYLTLRLGSDTLADAHADASRIEELIRRERPE